MALKILINNLLQKYRFSKRNKLSEGLTHNIHFITKVYLKVRLL